MNIHIYNLENSRRKLYVLVSSNLINDEIKEQFHLEFYLKVDRWMYEEE